MTAGVRRRAADVWTALVAVAVAVPCSWAAAPGTVGGPERAVFGAVDGWPDAWQRPLWVVQFVGVPGMPLLVAVVAGALRLWRPALAWRSCRR